MADPEVVIIGAGLAGLCCARRLRQQNINFLLIDAADGVGGRIRTDIVDGFRLDRGFQVFLTSYPEAKQVLAYSALALKPFLPGALIRKNGSFYPLSDPWRTPVAGLRSLFSPVGSVADKLRMAKVRSQSLRGSIDERMAEPEVTTLSRLQDAGFTSSMIDGFFKPFLGGIFLESQLQTSSRMFDFVFRMFALGNACLPADGMEAIPRQLASALPAPSIRTLCRVVRVEPSLVTLETGEQIRCKSVVVATEGTSAQALLGDGIASNAQAVTCLYFAARKPPIKQPILVLNGEGSGPINNLCVPTEVAPSYGPAGESLVSVTVLGIQSDEEQLRAAVIKQLEDWFGVEVKTWRHLRTYRIPYALPNQSPPALAEPQRAVRFGSGIYVCGDHRDTASIQGAMVSGRRAAEAVLEDRGH